MENTAIKIGRYKRILIERNSYWAILICVTIDFFSVLLSVNYPTSGTPAAMEIAMNTPFFSAYKVYLSIGFSLSLAGLIINTSSIIPIDFYFRNKYSFVFSNHWYTIFFKISVLVLGLFFCVLSTFFLEPDNDNPIGFAEYFYIAFGGIFILALVFQMVNSVLKLIRNRKDYVRIDSEKIAWFDDQNKSVLEVKFSEMKSIEKIWENTTKSPEIIGLQIISNSEEEFKIDFDSMSLLPQGKFISEVISQIITTSANAK